MKKTDNSYLKKKDVNFKLALLFFLFIFSFFFLIIIFFQDKEYKTDLIITTGYLNRSYEIKNLIKFKSIFLSENENLKINIFSYPYENKIKLEVITFHPESSKYMLNNFFNYYLNNTNSSRWKKAIININEWNKTIEKRQNELIKLYPKLDKYSTKDITLLTKEEKDNYEKLKNEIFTKERNIVILEQKKLDEINKTINDINQIKILRDVSEPKQIINKFILELFLAFIFSLYITIKINT